MKYLMNMMKISQAIFIKLFYLDIHQPCGLNVPFKVYINILNGNMRLQKCQLRVGEDVEVKLGCYPQ